ncbi:PAS domain-containing protein [Leptolyngbya ohadii]|uniref:PAS domain-containing protein n=1 Tax=Leptolyngbya ohadii TaxID=1962290 RepID=UPI000B59D39D|nr:PAS domain-containing protein [Leptolyngbya ohadii]
MLDRPSSQHPLHGQPESKTAPSLNGLSEAQALKQEAVNRELVNSEIISAAGMVLQLADGQIAACNANAERMMGLTAAQMTGWNSNSLTWRVVREDGTPFPGEEHPAMVALHTGKPCRDVVMGFYQPNGTLVWLLLNAQPLFQGSGDRPYAVLTTLTELPLHPAPTPSPIAEPKTAGEVIPPQEMPQPQFQAQSMLSLLIGENQALRDREERLRLALEGANLGLWDYDLEARQLVWSNRCKALFGVPANTPITYDRFLQRVHPDDREAIESAVGQTIQASVSSPYELEIRLRDSLPDAPHCHRWLCLKGNVYRNSSGQPSRMVGIAIDITHRKQAEAQLRESQQFIQQIADAVPGLLYVYDVIEQRNVYINQQIEDVLGYSPAQIEALHSNLFTEIFHPADLAIVAEHQAQLNYTQPNEVLECEYRMRSVNGEWRWLLSRDTVFRRTEAGQVWQILGTAQDITERKRVEHTLEESQARYAALAQNVPGVIYQYQILPDGRDRFLYMSLDCEELLGISQPAVLANVETMWATIHPDDRPGFEASIPMPAESGTQWQHEWRSLYPDGSVKWIKGIARAEQYSDGSVLWDGILIDVTDRKLAELALRSNEERYRCLAESIPQLIWTANAQGGLDDINQRWSDYTGFTLEQAQSDRWVQIVHPADIATLLQTWQQAQETRSLYQTECRMRSKTGEYRWFLVKAMPVQDQQGNIVKWYGTSTDIDDQKQLALERLRAFELEQAARTEAERASRMKDELLLLLSHELRTPLNPILGWSQLLQRQEFSRERTLAALKTIERNAHRQLQLVDDLLDVAKLLRGEIQLKLSQVNFLETIAAVVNSIRTTANAKQIELETFITVPENDSAGTAIQLLYGDPVRLQQIVWNLLTNAVKFTPQGGKITLCLEQTANAVQLQVSDTGAGIDPVFLPHVFDLFRQSSSSTTRQFEGLGLGLTIVRHLVHLHGGTIEASSAGRNQGATFTVQFPLPQRVGNHSDRNLNIASDMNSDITSDTNSGIASDIASEFTPELPV